MISILNDNTEIVTKIELQNDNPKYELNNYQEYQLGLIYHELLALARAF